MEPCDYHFETFGAGPTTSTSSVYLYCTTHRWESNAVGNPDEVAAADLKHKQEVADEGKT